MLGYTSLAPVQFGSSREVAFFMTFKIIGASAMPTTQAWGIEWETPLDAQYEEIHSMFVINNQLRIAQSTKTLQVPGLKLGAPIDQHYYDINADCSLTPAADARNSASYDYWRVFLPTSCIDMANG